MPRQSVLSVPRLGEGIVEVRIVRLLKRPGDPVAKDEVVYEMEHDKAAVEIESPSPGCSTRGRWRRATSYRSGRGGAAVARRPRPR